MSVNTRLVYKTWEWVYGNTAPLLTVSTARRSREAGTLCCYLVGFFTGLAEALPPTAALMVLVLCSASCDGARA